MTIEEMMGQFTKENQEQVRQFTTEHKSQGLTLIAGPNQGIASVIDKTFSKVEQRK